MPSSQEFVEHVLDLLAPLGPVEARRMFGGHGLYARGAMFGLLDGDELFLKTDAETRPRFVDAGCRMWIYREDVRETSYFRPPDEAHEDAGAMLPWARLALDAALRARAAIAARAASRERRGKAAITRGETTGAQRTGAAPARRGAGGRKPAPVSVRRAGKATTARREGPGGARVRRAGPRRAR